MSIRATDRKQIVENFKKGILIDGFDVYHCASSDKFIVRRRKDVQDDPTTINQEVESVRKKWGSFIC